MEPQSGLAENQHISEFIAVRIGWLNQAIEQQTRDLLAKAVGLSSLQWRCIATLFVRGPKTGKELAATIDTSGAQISRVTRPLLEQGLIVADAGTKKRVFGKLSLTEKGIEKYKQGLPYSRARNQWLLNSIPEDDIQQLYRLLAAIRQQVDKAPDFDSLMTTEEFENISKPSEDQQSKRATPRRKSHEGNRI